MMYIRFYKYKIATRQSILVMKNNTINTVKDREYGLTCF